MKDIQLKMIKLKREYLENSKEKEIQNMSRLIVLEIKKEKV